MSAGNLNTPNGKKNNFTYQFNVLRLLGEINGNSDQVEALLQSIENNTDNVEFLLSSILTSLQQGTEYEAKLVSDTCDANKIYLEVRVWDTDNSTWGPITYYNPSSSTPVTPIGLGTPGCLQYADPSSLLASILAELQAQGLTLTAIEGDTSNIDTSLDVALSTRLADATFTSRINTLGQKTKADSTPVVIASDQDSLPTSQPAVTTTGSITALNTNLSSGTATANSAVALTLNGSVGFAVDLRGTFTATIIIQGTVNGSNWITISVLPVGAALNVAQVASATAAGAWWGNGSAFVQIRATCSAYTSGTVNVTIRAVQETGIVFNVPTSQTTQAVSGTIAATQSGTWTVMPGNTANTTPWLANPLTPTVTTTGDTGAKTTSGNGSGVTNATSKGALISINVSAVSGTTPTCVFKIQGSADGGSTWIDIPGATTASITATGVYGIMIYPGIATVAGVATTGTTAQTSSTLPRLYRLAWTIGGTTPSFNITAANVSYLI